jgi:hypothetical protein
VKAPPLALPAIVRGSLKTGGPYHGDQGTREFFFGFSLQWANPRRTTTLVVDFEVSSRGLKPQSPSMMVNKDLTVGGAAYWRKEKDNVEETIRWWSQLGHR